ncbi:MAG: hypothetical protein PHS60_10065, partial [Zavarzinia sp.]|nr:hypothetical protein [Zavarzinia sp.]
LVSSTVGEGMEKLMAALGDHHAHLTGTGAGRMQRADQGAAWLAETVRDEYGKHGLKAAGGAIADAAGASPFGRAAGILDMLSRAR